MTVTLKNSINFVHKRNILYYIRLSQTHARYNIAAVSGAANIVPSFRKAICAGPILLATFTTKLDIIVYRRLFFFFFYFSFFVGFIFSLRSSMQNKIVFSLWCETVRYYSHRWWINKTFCGFEKCTVDRFDEMFFCNRELILWNLGAD